MKIYELIDKIEKKYPSAIQEEWDNSSLQVGSRDDLVSGIVIGLDVTFDLIEEAIKSKSNLIITHHPLLFDEIKNITDDITSQKIKLLIKNEINVYSIHTNYDKVDMHKKCAKYLDLENTKLMSNDIGIIGEIKDSLNIYNKLNMWNDYEEYNGDLSYYIIIGIAIITIIIIFKPKKSTVKKIAIVPGSGKEYLEEAISKKADVLITGDVSYHYALNGIEENILIIDTSHDGLEKIFVKEFHSFLNEIISDINIIEYESKQLGKII